MKINSSSSPQQIQARLLKLAALFLFLFALILNLSPAARERSWQVDYRWSHWLGFVIWAGLLALTHYQLRRRLPDSDPYLLPLAALLSGWGLLTVWRLDSSLGVRQALWLIVSSGVLILGLRLPADLRFLRRYKYLWLTGGLLLTALTLVFGTNPLGGGPRLWLGCCGVYFQPSEPLKLLLVVYLAAYFAGRLPLFPSAPSLPRPPAPPLPRSPRLILPLLAPTLLLTGLALLLLLVQRDLGTASIFIFLYTILLYIASGKKRVLLISLVGLGLAGIAGYFFFDVVRLRVDAWLNPWLDPSGRSYQIVQSLMAIANGGIIGRGPGMGSPGLVPISISDFIFSAISEETGLLGTIGLFALLGLFTARGMRAALRAPDSFRRLLAAGLTAYLGAQSVLIIGGNLRLLPLTGVTLPFVSYGGSSLLTSYLALLFLLVIGSQPEDEPAPLPHPQPYLLVTGLLGAGLVAAALVNGWWAVWRGPDLLTRTDNARRAISDRYVQRGSLLDRNATPINITQGESGGYSRIYPYPDLAPITGYTHPIYGQAGLEASLDLYLRGLQGNSASRIWLDHLLYGQPPPGLDVRLTIDLDLQRKADALLGEHAGAVVLLNAETGEILVMASHPTYDQNKLDEEGPRLAQDPHAPLLDRAVQGTYPPGSILDLFHQAAGLGAYPSKSSAENLYKTLGFYTSPELRLPVAAASAMSGELRVSPLQMALAAATLSNKGILPVPRLAMAVNTPHQGWVILPALGAPMQALSAQSASSTAEALMARGQPFWQATGKGIEIQENRSITWYLAGTLPGWQGTPLALVVVIEEDNSFFTEFLGRALMKEALQP
ncbi:MAG: FtsW/RodA/SpoVE family cell cycle protein [Anaerolineales bacterium]|nr:FtsW/RodA/SpoVE family cell cycle protein [Anaerolineales bacterium]